MFDASVNFRSHEVKGATKFFYFFFYSKNNFFLEPLYLTEGQKHNLIPLCNQERKPGFRHPSLLSRFTSKFQEPSGNLTPQESRNTAATGVVSGGKLEKAPLVSD